MIKEKLQKLVVIQGQKSFWKKKKNASFMYFALEDLKNHVFKMAEKQLK